MEASKRAHKAASCEYVVMMIEIPYTSRKLVECIGFQDIIRFPHLQDRNNRADLANKTLNLLSRGQVFNGCLRQINIGSDKGYVFNISSADLVARLVSKNIRVNYKLKQADRQTIISNAMSMFKEGSPFDVYRLDIKKFYESIDSKLLFERLIGEGKCSWQTVVLLDQFLNTLAAYDVTGLPRGLGISATLSEFYLKEFDLAVSALPGVFYYARFVDDILIVTSGQIARGSFESQVEELLPQGLEFHTAGKRDYIAVGKVAKEAAGKKLDGFDYLGYNIRIFSEHSEETVNGVFRRKVFCDISKVKVEKIKKRLLNSFSSYLASSQYPTDFALLKNRVRALTGNYYIVDPMTGVDIKTGIYYNYVQKNFVGRCALDELDAFIRGVLFSTKHQLSRRVISALSLDKRKQLAGYGFRTGFVNARFHSFKYDTLKKIKECWRK